MKFGVVVFPGTWSDKDCERALGPVLGQEAVSIWHQDTDLQGCDAIIRSEERRVGKECRSRWSPYH